MLRLFFSLTFPLMFAPKTCAFFAACVEVLILGPSTAFLAHLEFCFFFRLGLAPFCEIRRYSFCVFAI